MKINLSPLCLRVSVFNFRVLLFVLISIFSYQLILSQHTFKLNADLHETHVDLKQTRDINQQIQYLKEKIERSESPVKQVLQSILAELYYAYLIENLEGLKTQPVIAEDADNIYTWSGPSLIKTSQELYLQSLDLPEISQAIQSKELNLPIKGSGKYLFQPSLYDMLAHRALDFFTDPRAIRNPAPAEFRMQAQSLIMPPESYIQAIFPLLDSLNHTHISLGIFKDLLSYQLESKSYDALLDTDLRLIKWLRSYSSGLDKAGKYIRSLRHLIETYPDNQALADVQYELALVYVSIAGDFQPLGGESYKWDYRQALEICTYSIETYPNSRGAEKCRALIQLIEKAALRIAAEEVNLPGQPFRMQVNYRNLKHLYYRLYRIPFQQEKNFNRLKTAQARWDYAQQFSLSKSGDTYLANDGDLQFHRTETSIPALAAGTYALCASNSQSFDWSKDLIAVLPVKVSRLSTHIEQTSDSILLFVRDRESGKGLKDATIEIADKGNFLKQKVKKNGWLGIQRHSFMSGAISVNIHTETDSLVEKVSIPVLPSELYKAKTKAYVFTNSPSYFRGGFVSIKGLIRKNLDQDLSLIPDTSLTLFISQEGNYIDTLYVKSNSAGVFETTYPLPLHIQPGVLYVLCGAAYARIEVVDKQEVDFEIYMKQELEAYKPKDSVIILGQILGPPDTEWEDADVKYLVTRDVRFPDWKDYSWWKPLPHNREVLVKQGKSIIDSLGKFQVPFTARPDPSHPSSQRPVYFYKIRVLATDPNGERLLKTYNLLMSESGKALEIKAPEKVHVGDTLGIELGVKNLRGNPLPFEGKVIIESLVSPQTIYRKRRWLIPDLHLVSEGEYRSDFPNDVYGYEDDFRSWAIKDTLFQDSILSEKDAIQLSLQTDKWPTGMYRLRLILPSNESKLIQKRHYFTLSKAKESLSAIPEFFSFGLNKKIFSAGDTLMLRLKSSLPNLEVHYRLSKGRNTLEAKWLNTGAQEGLVKFPIYPEHSGTLSLLFSYVYQNEPVQMSQEIKVKSSAPDFEIIDKGDSKLEVTFEKVPKGKLLAFHSQVPSYMPKLSEFYFGLQRAAKPIETDRNVSYPEPARAALASGTIWEKPIPFPSFSYPSFSPKGMGSNIAEEQYFKQLTGEVLLFPSNRRSLPPKHRWVNLFANVVEEQIGTPSWAFNRLDKELSWRYSKDNYTEVVLDKKNVPLDFTEPLIPGNYSTMGLIMDSLGSFSFRRNIRRFSPSHVLLSEYDPFAEANTSKEFRCRILNIHPDSQTYTAKIHLEDQKFTDTLTLGPNKQASFAPTFSIPDQEGVYRVYAHIDNELDTTKREAFVFVAKRNYVFGRTHLDMEAKPKKRVLYVNTNSLGKIKANRSPVFYALRALPSLITQVNPKDAFSVQQALFAISLLEDFRKNDPRFEAWFYSTYEGFLKLSSLTELRLRLQRNLRDLQLSNGAFAEEESSLPSIPLTRQILQIEKDLQELGLHTYDFQKQSLAFAIHYLDSLYLHPAPEGIIWTKELGQYVELRRSLSSFSMETVWLPSWNALIQLHNQEEMPREKNKETNWIVANLLTKRPGPYWQPSIMKLLRMDWEQLQREGTKYLEVDDFSFVRKKNRVIFKKKKREKVYLEILMD